MIENKPKVIQEMADFTNFKVSRYQIPPEVSEFNLPLTFCFQLSKQQVNDLAEHCSIKSFKKNETVNMKGRGAIK